MRCARPRSRLVGTAAVALCFGIALGGLGSSTGARGDAGQAAAARPGVLAAHVESRRPSFSWTATPISAAERARMVNVSWRPGCPVPFSSLRDLYVRYWGFDAKAHTGHLVVNKDAVSPLVRVLRRLYLVGYPVRQMRTVEAFRGSDERSMRNDNTSAFNCRLVPGTTTWSQHAYGRAVDVNPLENPEVVGSHVDPPNARRFADRSLRSKGMIFHDGYVWRTFALVGWRWGGDWHSLKDYQHFSANGL